MTGYGAASYAQDNITINVEVKTLNSKFLDVNIRFPKAFSEKELEIRSMISDILTRGKVSITIDYFNQQETEMKQQYNEELFVKYYLQLKKLADRVVAPHDPLFQLALTSPEVTITDQEDNLDDEKWTLAQKLIREALEACNSFRVKEGAQLKDKFERYIQSIDSSLQEVEKRDPQRVEKIKARITSNLGQFIEEEDLDKNRLEQELIYYIEKLDITEEKVRLKNHLDHFSEVLEEKESLGKKLGFISQEIGREINTIGAKANDADIQRHVIRMKEELEKIKEQLLNVL